MARRRGFFLKIGSFQCQKARRAFWNFRGGGGGGGGGGGVQNHVQTKWNLKVALNNEIVDYWPFKQFGRMQNLKI